MRAWVIVLGDVGRSPRMQYHTSSILKTEQYQVNLIGTKGAELIEELRDPAAQDRLTVNYIPSVPRWVTKLPGPLRLPLKALLQLLTLLWMLLVSLPRPDVILLQLPPALPTMAACWLAALRHRSRLIYDWHNFAYSLMALNLSRRHILVRLGEAYERWFGKKAAGNLCVTAAMQRDLVENWGVSAPVVFHDRPPKMFKPATLEQQHALFKKLQPDLEKPMHLTDFAADMVKEGCSNAGLTLRTRQCGSDTNNESDLNNQSFNSSGNSGSSKTSRKKGVRGNKDVVQVEMREDRPAVVVSSTSWTPDEDFRFLLQAAQLYDTAARKKQHNTKGPLPKVLFLVTGKGPQRAHYEQAMQSMNLQFVAFRTLWLDPEDYPVLLGCADVGVSLHASSSGLDLPMKVVDMFGCGLPVCALSYNCIEELVRHGENGLLFSTAEELAYHLQDLLRGFPTTVDCRSEFKPGVGSTSRSGGNENKGGDVNEALIVKLRKGVESSMSVRWEEAWREIVLPVLQRRKIEKN